MTVDRRWPELERLTVLPKRVAAPVQEVCSRTFVDALWNRKVGEIHFFIGEANSGVWQQPISTDRPWSQGTVDYVTKTIQRARMAAREKDRKLAAHKTSEESDRREDRGREAEDRKRDHEDILRKARNRRDMGRHFKGGAVVNGLKGAKA